MVASPDESGLSFNICCNPYKFKKSLPGIAAMRKDVHLRSDLHWTPLQKITFRFFFVFLILQEAFAEGLYIISFSYTRNITLGIVSLTEKIFVAPCLWLNDHIFHLNYVPGSWSTFTLTLHTIRDIAYFFIAFLVCLLWSVFDRKRPNYNKLYNRFSQSQVIILSVFMFSYGIIKIFPVQMRFPSFTDLHRSVGDLTPFELIWTTFGYGTPYQVFCGFFESLGAILILFNRTRLAGLLAIAIVLINVILLNYTYQVGVLILSFTILLITLFLLAPYAHQLFDFFFKDSSLTKFKNEITSEKPKLRVSQVLLVLLMGSFLLSLVFNAYKRYTDNKTAHNSRKYSLIKNHIVNNDTLKPIENDTLRWRSWNERISDGKRFVTISTMKRDVSPTYELRRDSSRQILMLHPLRQKNSATLTFNYINTDYENWSLIGTIQGKKVKVDLQMINPDTIMKLLKVKRTVLPTD